MILASANRYSQPRFTAISPSRPGEFGCALLWVAISGRTHELCGSDCARNGALGESYSGTARISNPSGSAVENHRRFGARIAGGAKVLWNVPPDLSLVAHLKRILPHRRPSPGGVT